MKSKNIMKKIGSAFLLYLMVLNFAYAQQESQYTQFMHNQMYVNPAFAGARGIPSFTVLYRNQWTGLTGSPTSGMLSFNAPMFNDRVGFGLTLSNHKIGIMNSFYATMAYSYHVKFNDEAGVRFGLQGSMRRLGINFADPTNIPGQNDDPSMADGELGKDFSGNFGIGAYFTLKQTYIGISAPRLFPNEIGFDNIPQIAKEVPHFYFSAGTMVPIGKSLHLKPALLAKYVKNAPFDLDFNLSFVYNLKYTAGLSYRLGGTGAGDSIGFMMMFQFGSLALGLSNDFTISEIRKQVGASPEVLVRYDFIKETTDLQDPRYFY